MPIQLPDLDDRTYADLVQEGLELIPTYSPQWTNHNVADPGITFLELFAYLADIFIYRLNRVSDANRMKFLKLLTGEQISDMDREALDNALRDATLALRKVSRAVTRQDFEMIAREATNLEAPEQQVKRVMCFSRRNLDAMTIEERLRDRPGHMSVVFVPGDPWADTQTVESIKSRVSGYIESKRMLNSRVHISGPRYVNVGVRIRIAVLPGASRTALRVAVLQKLSKFFHPLQGGPEGLGWPFGRSVFTSDVYRLLESIDGVDFVNVVEFDVADPGRMRRNDFDEVIEIQLWPEELVHIEITELTFGNAEDVARVGAGA